MSDVGISALDDYFGTGWTDGGKDIRGVRHEVEMLAQEASDRMLYRSGENKAGLVGLIASDGGLVWASTGKMRLYHVRGGVAEHVNRGEGTGDDTEQFNWLEYNKRRADPGQVGYSGKLGLRTGDALLAVAEDAASADRGSGAASYMEMLSDYVVTAATTDTTSSRTIADGFAGLSGRRDRLAAVVRVYDSSASPRAPFSAPGEHVVTEPKADASNPPGTEARRDAGPSEDERAKLKDLLQSPLFGLIEAAAAGDTQTKADAGRRILEALAMPESRSSPDIGQFDRAVSGYVKYWGGDDRRSRLNRLFRAWGSGYQITGKWEKKGADEALAAMVDHLIDLRASLREPELPGAAAEAAPAEPSTAEPAGQATTPSEETGATARDRAAGEIIPIAGTSSGGEDTQSEDRRNRLRTWLGELVSDLAMGVHMYYDRELHAEVMKFARRDLRDGFANRPAVPEEGYGPAKPSAYYQLGRVAMLYWRASAPQMVIQEVRNGYNHQPPLTEPDQSEPSRAYRFGRMLRMWKEE